MKQLIWGPQSDHIGLVGAHVPLANLLAREQGSLGIRAVLGITSGSTQKEAGLVSGQVRLVGTHCWVRYSGFAGHSQEGSRVARAHTVRGRDHGARAAAGPSNL